MLNQWIIKSGVVFILIAFGFTSPMIRSEDKVYRVDSSKLPLIDYSKQFKVHEAGMFNKTFETREVEKKILDLPAYAGNLKPLSLTEWRAPKTDAYSKNLEMREFEIKKAVEKWSKIVDFNNEEAYSPKENLSPEAEKKAPLPEDPIESQIVEIPGSIGGEELKNVINKGMKAEEITIGRGFNSKKIGVNFKVQPETKLPPKLESSP
jgi:hypothetical protein